MKIAKKIIFFLVFIISGYSYAQIQKFDLSNINTVKEAESYYRSCMSILFKDSVSRENMLEMYYRLFALGERICMRSMDDIKDIDKYHCNIHASNFDEEMALNHLRLLVSENYRCVQQILWPYFGKPMKSSCLQNFLDYYSGGYKRLSAKFEQRILWYETDLSGIRFIEIHNLDDNFAYDIKVFHKLKNNKILEREYTLMPDCSEIITSSIEEEKFIYFYPTSIEIVNKYYVGER